MMLGGPTGAPFAVPVMRPSRRFPIDACNETRRATGFGENQVAGFRFIVAPRTAADILLTPLFGAILGYLCP